MWTEDDKLRSQLWEAFRQLSDATRTEMKLSQWAAKCPPLREVLAEAIQSQSEERIHWSGVMEALNHLAVEAVDGIRRPQKTLDDQRHKLKRPTSTELPLEEPAAATAHSQHASRPELASEELPVDEKMIYSIVNEFLGKITFNNPEAEEFAGSSVDG